MGGAGPLIWARGTPCLHPLLWEMWARRLPPIVPEAGDPTPPRCTSPNVPVMAVGELEAVGASRGSAHGGAVLPAPGRAARAMGLLLAGWHHCCPASLFSRPLQILVFHLYICLEDFSFFSRGVSIPQLLFNQTDDCLSLCQEQFWANVHSDNLGNPLMQTHTCTFLSCWLLLFWTLCQGWAHQVTHQATNCWNIPWRSEASTGQSCYASIISMLLSYLHK